MNAPVVDVRASVSEQEWQIRTDLAAAYRLIAHFGWDDLVFTHISARVPGPEHHFLINPYGMMFDEITASSLVKVDQACRPVLATDHPVNPAGFVIHSCIHDGRADVACVIHTHTPAGVAVSAQAGGLLPISQQAAVLMHRVGYHDYEGIAVRDDEKPRLQRDLGRNSCLVLRNHGLLTVGRTVAEAFQFMFTLQRACEIQVMAQAGGPLVEIGEPVIAGIRDALRLALTDKGSALAWPALRRRLDRINPGYED
ncbi:MAG: class II aldolase/adducin family protein [Burkholderiaceae bacterium]